MRWLLTLTLTLLGIFGVTDIALGFDSQGHRGARGLMPENTLAAFAQALSIGVNTLELDIGATREGVLVVTHNPRLDPDTTRDKNGDWLNQSGPAIRSLSLEELRTFDVGRAKPGTRHHRRFADQVAVDGAYIPTLKEVLQLVQRSGNETVRLNIETKLRPTEPELYLDPEDLVAKLLNVLKDQGFLGRVTIQSFDWRTLQIVQRLAADIPTSYLSVQQSWYDNLRAGEEGPSPWTAGFDIDTYGGSVPKMVKAAGGRIWSTFHEEVSPELILQAHDLGLEVKVWTVNNTDRMEALIDMGVDGIITDYPDRLRIVLKKRGMPLPLPTPVSY